MLVSGHGTAFGGVYQCAVRSEAFLSGDERKKASKSRIFEILSMIRAVVEGRGGMCI